MGAVSILIWLLRALLLGRATVVSENSALRQQLTVLQRSVKRLRLQRRNRLCWMRLSRFQKDRRSCPLIVKPDIVRPGRIR